MADKEKGGYHAWSTEETKVLVELLVEAIQRGWRDSSGSLNKATVENKILPVLNERLGCQKTHTHYLSRYKYLRSLHSNYQELQRHSSGFGWDPVLKKFTATEEVWANYLKGHPKHKYMRYESNDYVEDLKIIFDCATANGGFSLGLGDTTDARTYITSDTQVEDYSNSYERDDVYVLSSHQDSPTNVASPSLNSRGKKLIPRKRSRMDTCSNSDDLANDCNDSMITVSNKILSVIQQREERQQKEAEKREEKSRLEAEQREAQKKKNNVWDAMKEVPNLDQRIKFKAVTLIYSLGMKDVFTDMSIEERFGWVQSNISLD